ncbi:MAG: hypothetical protein WA416_07155 [Candidatus Sulfotelmatobacter sp.]
MPTEIRVLSFSKIELFEALRDYCSHTGRRLPPDAAERLVLTQESEVRVTLNSLGEESEMKFAENEVGAALVMFCIRKQIPIAKRATKSLEITGETVSLHLKIGP